MFGRLQNVDGSTTAMDPCLRQDDVNFGSQISQFTMPALPRTPALLLSLCIA